MTGFTGRVCGIKVGIFLTDRGALISLFFVAGITGIANKGTVY
jgi:hypothetical protein